MNNVINHIGISGGKDSTALLLWAVHESGYPRESLRATFCDTHNEVPETYNHVAMLSEKAHPVLTLQPELGFYDLAKKKKRFPSTRARFCTQMLKMIPTQQYLLGLMRDGHDVLNLSGVRAAESEDRAKLPEREWDGFFACDVYRPILHWTIEDVWAIHERYGIPRNPLYDQGSQRVGCYPCIMSRKSEIRHIAIHRPERFDMIRKAETEFDNPNAFSTFFSRDKVPLRFRTKEIVTADGKKMKVPQIDDVIEWSLTGYRAQSGGKNQGSFEFMDEVAPACNSQYGFCE